MRTIFRFPHAVTALAFVGVLAVSPRTTPQRPTFSVEVALVRVDVSVTRRNLPVVGLTSADFVLFDNGVKQTLQPLTVEELPVEAWLLLDMSESVRPALSQVVQVASSFVDGLAPGRDRVALVTFSEKVLVRQRPTSDVGAMRRALASLQPSGITALYDATYVALRLRQPGAERGVLVVLTDGYDNISWLSPDQVVAAAERSDLVSYGVAVHGSSQIVNGRRPGPNREPSDTPQYRFLRRIAAATGGRVFDATWPDLEQSFTTILREIRARYVLSYYPTTTTPGWHKLEVKLARARGDVRARPGYNVQSAGHDWRPQDRGPGGVK
jgi:Ca-activated chloride channel homolog